MSRILSVLLLAFVLLAVTGAPAHANDDYLVPITVGSRTFTLTVSVGTTGVSVRVGDPAVTLGTVTKATRAVAAAATPTATTPTATPAPATLDDQKAQAVTIPYDELFRYNEQHVGKVVRYVGQVVQVQENACILCDTPSYTLRVEVTQGNYGFWDDPIWVDYVGKDRFLEDDIVTVWGVVTGLQSYTAVLGNQVTIPQIEAIDLQLGELENPRPAAAPGAPTANGNANLRGGPGTGYAVTGGVKAGDALELTARNAAGDWLQLAGGAWIATFLVDGAPDDLPVATDIPAAPTAAPTTAASTAPAAAAGATPVAPSSQGETDNTASASSSIVPIGQEIEAGGWRFKVSEVHKRKAVYFYNDAHVAMGHYLIVILDATNLQGGTDYFDRAIDPWVTDEPGNVFDISGTASGYARWQYGGISSIYTDVDPGDFVRIAIAVDLPDATGKVLLSTDVGKWIDLGDFAAMASEDN